MSDRLVAFLKARLAEDEAAALAAAEGPWELRWDDQDHQLWSPGKEWPISEWTYAIYPRGERGEVERAECDTGTQEHIARHDPQRVLAEVAATQALLTDWQYYEDRADDLFGDDPRWDSGAHMALTTAIKHRAAVYAGHPDYDEKWKP